MSIYVWEANLWSVTDNILYGINITPYFSLGGIAIDDLTGRVDERIRDGEDVSFLVIIQFIL